MKEKGKKGAEKEDQEHTAQRSDSYLSPGDPLPTWYTQGPFPVPLLYPEPRDVLG